MEQSNFGEMANEELLCASEEELLREALRQAKVILSTRLPIDFLPTVLESEDFISSAECQMIKGERNDVEKSLKLLDMIEKKSIPAIQTFLGILKSNKNMRGYGYLAEMVERDCAALVGKKAVTSDASHVLKKYEDEYFRVTNAKLKLLELMRKGVISDDLVMKIESADHEEAQELLFKHLHRNANVAKLREYCRIAISADGYPKMQDLGEKMLRNLPPEGAGQTCGQASSQAEAQACATPPRRGNTSPPCPITQLPQSSPKRSVCLEPSMDRDNCMRLPPMPVDLQVISSILLEQNVYITGIATDPESHCVLVFSLNQLRWSKLKVAPNYNAPIAVISGHITLIGGRVSEDKLTNLVYSWIDGEWKQIVPPMPKQRLASGVCHHDGLLLVMGGVEDTNQTKPVDTVVVYIVSRKHWVTPESLRLPKGLRSAHVVMCKEYLYLVGGGDAFPAQPQYGGVEAWRARWDDIKKVSVEAADEQGVQTHTPKKEPSKEVKEAVIEAEDAPKEGEHTRTAEEEHSKSIWRRIANPPAVRPTVVSSKDSLMVVGGANECGIPQEGIYEFVDDDSLGSWNLVGNMSVGRCRHAVVPLGRRGATLFVAGGYVPESEEKDEGSIKSSSAELVAL